MWTIAEAKAAALELMTLVRTAQETGVSPPRETLRAYRAALRTCSEPALCAFLETLIARAGVETLETILALLTGRTTGHPTHPTGEIGVA